MKIWDRKYNCFLFVPYSDTGIHGDEKSCFVGKGGRGYSYEKIRENESLENDDYLPPESEKSGKRFLCVEDDAELVRCPHCKHVFNSSDTFSYTLDHDNFPTIPHLHCRKCWAGNKFYPDDNGETPVPEYDFYDFKSVEDT